MRKKLRTRQAALRGPRVAALGLASLAFVVGACSSSSTSSGTTATTASVCGQATALKQSVADLKNVDVVKNGTSSLNAAVADVKSNLDALAKSGTSQIQPELDALQTSLQQLDTAIKNVSSTGVNQVVTSFGSVKQSGDDLLQKLDSLKC